LKTNLINLIPTAGRKVTADFLREGGKRVGFLGRNYLKGRGEKKKKKDLGEVREWRGKKILPL